MTPRSVILMKAFWFSSHSSEAMSFSKFASFVSKVTNEEFLWVPPPDCNTAELHNECFSLFMLSSFYKARANTLPGGGKQCKFLVRQLWLLRQKWQIWKMTLPQKNCHRIQTPSSKLMILVSSFWKKNIIHNNWHSLFILFLVFLQSLIVSVAFFLGHPV